MGAEETAALAAAQGVVPRAVQDLFAQLSSKSTEGEGEAGVQYTVYCSFLQIYNEKVHDLLQEATAASPALAIHEHDVDGVYVEGLSEYLVTSATDCLRLVAFGAANRAVRATTYNESSSRSHAILQLQIERQVSGDTRITRSKLNLVDLAGSERWDMSGPGSAAHTSEMTHINLSLLTLSKCITALAKRDKATAGSTSPRLGITADEGGGPVRHVPYRESKLTHLLKDALGGNSKTRLVCTLSPAAPSAGESFQTLVFADSAKRVMTHAKINTSMLPDRVLVKMLQAEVARLRERLLALGDVGAAFGGDGSAPAVPVPTQAASAMAPSDAHPPGDGPAPPAEVAAAMVRLEQQLAEANAEKTRLAQQLAMSRGHDESEGDTATFLTSVPDMPLGGLSKAGGAVAAAQEHYIAGEGAFVALQGTMEAFFNLDIEEEELQASMKQILPKLRKEWAAGYTLLASAAEQAGHTQGAKGGSPAAGPREDAQTPTAAKEEAVADRSGGSEGGSSEGSVDSAPERAASPAAGTALQPPATTDTQAEPRRSSVVEDAVALEEGGSEGVPGAAKPPSARSGHAGVVASLRAASSSGPSLRQAPPSPLTSPGMEGDVQHSFREGGPTSAASARSQPTPPPGPLPAVSPPPNRRRLAAATGEAEGSSGSQASSPRGDLSASQLVLRRRGKDGKLSETARSSGTNLPALAGLGDAADAAEKEKQLTAKLKSVQREVEKREKLAAWLEEKSRRQEAMAAAAREAEEAALEEEAKREKARQRRAKNVKKRLERYRKKLAKQQAAAEAEPASRHSSTAGSAGTGTRKSKKKKGTASKKAQQAADMQGWAALGDTGMSGMFQAHASGPTAGVSPQVAYAMALQQQAALAMAAATGGGAPGGAMPAQGMAPFPGAVAFPWMMAPHPAMARGGGGGLPSLPSRHSSTGGEDDPRETEPPPQHELDTPPSLAALPPLDVHRAGASVAGSAAAHPSSPGGEQTPGRSAQSSVDAMAALAAQARAAATGGMPLQSEPALPVTMTTPLTHGGMLGETQQSVDRDVPLQPTHGGLSAPPARKAPQRTAKGRKPASPRAPTSTSGSVGRQHAPAVAASASSGSSAQPDAVDEPPQASQGRQESARQSRGRSRTEQLAAIYGAPPVGAGGAHPDAHTRRLRLRGLRHNAGFDRDEDGGGEEDSDASYGDDDFEDEGHAEARQASKGGGGAAPPAKDSMHSRIDSSGAAALLGLVDGL